MFPKIKVSEGNSWFNWSFHFSLGNRASRWPWKRYIYYWCVGQTSTRLGTRMGFFCRGRVWEAIIKGGKCFVRVQYRWGSLLCMKLILIFSSNSFFQFCILWIRKTSLFFFIFTRVFVLRVFSICAFLRKIFTGLWSFSLKCARHLNETQTLPSDPLRNSVHKWNLLSSSGRRRNPNLQVTGSLCLLCRAHCHPHGGETDENSSDGDKTGWGHSLTFPGMLAPRALVPCQSGTRNRLTRQDAFASIPAPWAVQSQAQGSLWTRSFRQAPKTCPQWARL